MASSKTAKKGGSASLLQHRSLPEQVHDVLRLRILNNELPAGTALIELALAEEFGVSRTTIRSAMRELQAERLIEVSPRRGSTVTRMSERDIEEVCYARFVLESAGLPETLPGARAQLVEEMAAALRRPDRFRLPGPNDVAQPDDDDRPAGRRGRPRTQGRLLAGRPRPCR